MIKKLLNKIKNIFIKKEVKEDIDIKVISIK
jgi:hypothetical protein